MNATDVLFHTAHASFDSGCFAQTAEICRHALHDRPEDGLLWQLLGQAYAALGLFDEAQAALETATCLTALNPQARCALAEAYLRSGHPEVARTNYVDLAQGQACPVPLLSRVAKGLGRLDENRLALQVCKRLAALRPGHHAAWFGVAYYRSVLGASPAAILPTVARAYQLAPQVLSYHVSLALLLDTLGRGAEAYGLMREVPAEQLQCPNSVRRLLRMFQQQQDKGRAAAWRAWLDRLNEQRGSHGKDEPWQTEQL